MPSTPLPIGMICCIPSSGFFADERLGTPLALVPLPPDDGGVDGGGELVGGGGTGVVSPVGGGGGGDVTGGRVMGGRVVVGGSAMSIGSAAIEPTTRAVG